MGMSLQNIAGKHLWLNQELLGESFKSMGIVERSSFVPGFEHCESLYTHCSPMYL